MPAPGDVFPLRSLPRYGAASASRSLSDPGQEQATSSTFPPGPLEAPSTRRPVETTSEKKLERSSSGASADNHTTSHRARTHLPLPPSTLKQQNCPRLFVWNSADAKGQQQTTKTPARREPLPQRRSKHLVDRISLISAAFCWARLSLDSAATSSPAPLAAELGFPWSGDDALAAAPSSGRASARNDETDRLAWTRAPSRQG